MSANWRSIESAPKDGTRLLVWDGRYMTIAYWMDGLHARWKRQDGYDGLSGFDKPTHWLPLPVAPDPCEALRCT